MTAVWVIAAGMLLAAAAITLVRILSGPNTLDRLVALDTLIALAMCSLAGWAAYSLDSTVIPAVVALSLLSFVGSVAIARFRVRDDVVRVAPPAPGETVGVDTPAADPQPIPDPGVPTGADASAPLYPAPPLDPSESEHDDGPAR